MIYSADFHLHSCLSPCGDLEMSPANIARVLSRLKIDVAALTDHNSAENVATFEKVCRENSVLPLFGVEAQPQEEIHVLCLFSRPEEALELGHFLYEKMPDIMNVPEKTGDQVYVNENDEILGEVDKYLITSACISLEELTQKARGLNGLVIPAHVDRPAFSMYSQFGCIVPGDWDALELVRLPKSPDFDTLGYPLITSSDAHYPEHIGRRAFELDTGGEILKMKNGYVDIEVVRRALQRRTRG